MSRSFSHRGLLAIRRSGSRREWAFTFLEIVVVVVLLGILFTFAAPRLSGLSPRYRLRSAARLVGTQIEQARLTAISRGVWTAVYYELDGDDSYFQIVGPPPPDYPNMPVEEREPYAKEDLPDGVRIDRVRIRGTQETVTDGRVTVLFSPLGTNGSHSVTLASSDGRYLTVELNAITGIIDFFESKDYEGGFEDFEG